MKSIRLQLEAIISKIEPLDELEHLHQTETLQWIRGDDPLFRIQKPNIPSKHLVSYCVVFDPYSRKILLTEHKKSNLWLPPGGHVEINEHPKITAQRECEEELRTKGIHFLFDFPIFLTVTPTVEATIESHIDVSLWYVLRGLDTNCYKFNEEEFHSIRWFNFNEIPYERSDRHMKRFLKKLATITTVS